MPEAHARRQGVPAQPLSIRKLSLCEDDDDHSFYILSAHRTGLEKKDRSRRPFAFL